MSLGHETKPNDTKTPPVGFFHIQTLEKKDYLVSFKADHILVQSNAGLVQ